MEAIIITLIADDHDDSQDDSQDENRVRIMFLPQTMRQTEFVVSFSCWSAGERLPVNKFKTAPLT